MIERLKTAIKNAQNICVFTGAGISVPSGIPDFRSADGLYNQKTGSNIRPEEMISHSFFVNHTDMFYEFYKSKMIYLDAKPNIAHNFIFELQEQGKNVSVVTQNIDGLHTVAGVKNVYEIHGSVHRNNCMKCGKFYDADYVMKATGVPKCSCGGTIKPDVVLYEEPLNDAVVNGAIRTIRNADLLIIIGTSLVVYPAASFVRYFCGAHLAIINLEPTGMDSIADIKIYDDVVNVIKQLND
ncbi:MAG: NAD-dependent protein deacylase [Ruminococcaceae bacterium]|nr:NAD-dependent protein deacylase [Oscillospiraceae bacterium]